MNLTLYTHFVNRSNVTKRKITLKSLLPNDIEDDGDNMPAIIIAYV